MRALKKGDFPRWTLFIQMMPEKDAAKYRFHPFDLTKVWLKKDYPLIEVGVMELNRNPENYFAEVEQAAFNPANIVPGIGFSPDKMLQGRLFSYGDAQRYRLGVNHHLIPVNTARCPFHSYHRDGAMRVDGNYGSTLGYEPNSYGEWQQQPEFAEPPLALDGAADHWDFRKDDDDYYTQPGLLFRLMSPEQQKALFENTARCHRRCAQGDSVPPYRQLPEGRPCLWQGRGGCAGHSLQRDSEMGRLPLKPFKTPVYKGSSGFHFSYNSQGIRHGGLPCALFSRQRRWCIHELKGAAEAFMELKP